MTVSPKRLNFVHYSTIAMHDFSHILEQWYDTHGRDLPWRSTRDAYRIWISEIILQQTRVEQGMDYYLRFVRRFPDVRSLAEASEDEVLRIWQGLGYYSRARHLHEAARRIENMGAFPTTPEGLLALPGVGEYTAAAIGSFAYDLPMAVVDGNVFRVLARYFGIDTPVDTTAGKREIRLLANEMLDIHEPGKYNQAIMDFGALQCVPSHPSCDECPLVESCSARSCGMVDLWPQKSRRTKVKDRFFTYIYLRDTCNRTLVHKRVENDIWRGLYEWPLIESETSLPVEEVQKLFPQARLTLFLQGVQHQLSHRLLHIDFYLAEVTDLPEEKGRAVEEQGLANLAFPKPLVEAMASLETLLKRE